MKNKNEIFYRFCNCVKCPNSVGIVPISWLSSNRLFNDLIYYDNKQFIQWKKILNIFTGLVIVLIFQIRLEWDNSVDYSRDLYSINLIYYDKQNNLLNEK